jgi:hypothetical protein
LDHNVLDQLVRKTIVFCVQKRPEMAGIEAEQFQEPLVHDVVIAVRHVTIKAARCNRAA